MLNPHYQESFFQSSLDGSREPYLLHLPQNRAPEALLVGLHTWSADRFNQQAAMLPYCQDRGWALLLPEFRGPNLVENPRALQAGGSPLARRDIVDATEHVIAQHFDGKRPPCFLLGGSGGGHMALQVAGREAFRWDAVSSWCPITHLGDWQKENANYRAHIEAVCGGAPGASADIDARYQEGSPIYAAAQLATCRLQLGHGRGDASVPYTHSWKMALAIEAEHPASFFFHLFDGGHELFFPEAFGFFDATLKRQSEKSLTG